MANRSRVVRECIAGFRHTIDALREEEIARGRMLSRPTLFLLGVDNTVRQTLETAVVSAGCAVEYHGSARTFLNGYDPNRPGCVILDAAMLEASDAAELQQKLSSSDPVLPVIVLAGQEPLPPASRGFTLSPVDFLRKPVGPSELCRRALTAAARDQEARVRVSLIGELHARAARLTEQERQVMTLMVQGVTQKQIAAQLKIGMRTVQLRRSRIMRKMQALSLAQLVQFALILNRPGPKAEQPQVHSDRT